MQQLLKAYRDETGDLSEPIGAAFVSDQELRLPQPPQLPQLWRHAADASAVELFALGGARDYRYKR